MKEFIKELKCTSKPIAKLGCVLVPFLTESKLFWFRFHRKQGEAWWSVQNSQEAIQKNQTKTCQQGGERYDYIDRPLR